MAVYIVKLSGNLADYVLHRHGLGLVSIGVIIGKKILLFQNVVSSHLFKLNIEVAYVAHLSLQTQDGWLDNGRE